MGVKVFVKLTGAFLASVLAAIHKQCWVCFQSCSRQICQLTILILMSVQNKTLTCSPCLLIRTLHFYSFCCIEILLGEDKSNQN